MSELMLVMKPVSVEMKLRWPFRVCVLYGLWFGGCLLEVG